MRVWYYIGRKLNRKLLWNQRRTFLLLIFIAIGMLTVVISLLKFIDK
jgi:hypothetical protein